MLDAYFVSDRMFACISGGGIGIRLPVATATELQFSRNDVVPFSPGGMASTREWIQINCASLEFVRFRVSSLNHLWTRTVVAVSCGLLACRRNTRA